VAFAEHAAILKSFVRRKMLLVVSFVVKQAMWPAFAQSKVRETGRAPEWEPEIERCKGDCVNRRSSVAAKLYWDGKE
jgi:hypothetical protein